MSRASRLTALAAAWLVAGCGGGGSGGTGPCTPGAATQLVKTGGDAQVWYFNNPLPAMLSVKALDANNCVVPGVVINWTVASGGGGVSPPQSTTNSSGVASAADSVGSSTPQSVRATPAITSLPTLTFSATASAAPTSGAVSVGNNVFTPNNAVVQVGGTVTWTWNSGGVEHTLTFTSGPPPLPAQTDQTTGTKAIMFNTVGTYGYHCIIHSGMDGTLLVVH
jgi:plastocyanin